MMISKIIDEPKQTADPYFMTNGKKVYKTSCLKAISSAQQLSKYGLRLVQ